MKYYNCPNCDSRFPARPAACPSCGEPVAAADWKEIDVEAPPMPEKPTAVELHGDLGHPFIFRRQSYAMSVGRPSLAAVSSQVNCCEREQFVLQWEGDACSIAPPLQPPRNATFVDGVRLTGKMPLRQGGGIDLRGNSGRTAMPLTVLYS